MLWLARCGLTDLDGISCFPSLQVGLQCLGLGGCWLALLVAVLDIGEGRVLGHLCSV